MSYLVLARKYRPGNFDEIIGQVHVTRTLKNAIGKEKLHHAFLFTGTRGIGKTTTARVLAKALCCQSADGPVPEPCGKCGMCLAISKGSAVDINEIDGASNNSVNDIRDLRDGIQYRPQQARFKIYIIDEVHMLTTAAFNALLKTLEEPPEHVKFMFATTEPHKIPQTILSRCQRYDFKSVSVLDISAHLKGIVEKEGVGMTEGALATLARMARGSVRDGLSLLDSVIAYSGDSISEEDVRVVLGLSDAATFERVAKALTERDAPELFAAVADLVDYGHDLRQFGNDFLEYLRDAVLLRSLPDAAATLGRTEAETAAIKKLSAKAETAEWIAWFDLMVEGQERIARSEQARYMLELTLSKMLQVGKLRPIDDLLAGVKKLMLKGGRGPDSQKPGAGSGAPRAGSAGAAGDDKPIDIALVRSIGEESPGPPETWKDLVERIKSSSRTMWSALMNSDLLDWGGDTIRIECPHPSVHWDQIGARDKSEELSGLASELMGRKLSFEVLKGDSGAGAKSIAGEEREKRLNRRMEMIKKGEADTTVRLVREVFGGGEVTVHPLEGKSNS